MPRRDWHCGQGIGRTVVISMETFDAGFQVSDFRVAAWLCHAPAFAGRRASLPNVNRSQRPPLPLAKNSGRLGVRRAVVLVSCLALEGLLRMDSLNTHYVAVERLEPADAHRT